MTASTELHTAFFHCLKYKDQDVIDLYVALRTVLLELYLNATELLYQSHALRSL
jgi:hypothetical protein